MRMTLEFITSAASPMARVYPRIRGGPRAKVPTTRSGDRLASQASAAYLVGSELAPASSHSVRGSRLRR